MAILFTAEWKILIEEGFLTRLAIAAFCGTVIGLERELADKPAGIRTNALVAIGSCLFSLLSVYCWKHIAGGVPQVDPGRIAAQIVSGLGFLGAALVIRTGTSLVGITTAATIWLVAAIGCAAGFGLPLLAIVVTLSTSAFLLIVGKLEYRSSRISPKTEEPSE